MLLTHQIQLKYNSNTTQIQLKYNKQQIDTYFRQFPSFYLTDFSVQLRKFKLEENLIWKSN